MLKPLKEQHFSEQSLALLMQYLREWAGQVTSQDILGGILLKDLEVSTTATWFVHGLGRVPTGWIVVDKNADVRVWKTDASNTRIQLDSSGSATISIWVF